MAKSFFDERLKNLLRLTSLIDISRALFPGADIAASDQELIHMVQRRFEETILSNLIRLVSVFSEPPPLLVQVIREYEYRNLKALIRNRFAPSNPLRLWDIGKYARVPVIAEGFPDYLRDTPFADLVGRIKNENLFELEFKLDTRYYGELLGTVMDLPRAEKKLAEPLLREELLLQNIIWALRLRYYFNRSEAEAKELHFPFHYAEITRHVEKVYELSTDFSDQWMAWKYGALLCANPDGGMDLGETELRAVRRLYKKFRHAFFHNPFRLTSVFAFFRLKHYEARIIQSVTEGVRMGIPYNDLSRILGVA